MATLPPHWLVAGVIALWILASLLVAFFDDDLDKPSDPLKSRMPYDDYDDD